MTIKKDKVPIRNIILFSLLITIIIYLLFSMYIKMHIAQLDSAEKIGYDNGKEDALNYMNSAILNQLNINGYIILNYPVGNKTVPIKLMPVIPADFAKNE